MAQLERHRRDHIDEDEARLTLYLSGDRLQLNGYGDELPQPPHDTVAETRKRLVIEGSRRRSRTSSSHEDR